MNIAKSKLKQLIKEELETVLQEGPLGAIVRMRRENKEHFNMLSNQLKNLESMIEEIRLNWGDPDS
tara:strand:- start:349 stop:546 length:198 start_codon:yes stop_codon:yes gene_type:complete